jgi:hypothetical protein
MLITVSVQECTRGIKCRHATDADNDDTKSSSERLCAVHRPGTKAPGLIGSDPDDFPVFDRLIEQAPDETCIGSGHRVWEAAECLPRRGWRFNGAGYGGGRRDTTSNRAAILK